MRLPGPPQYPHSGQCCRGSANYGDSVRGVGAATLLRTGSGVEAEGREDSPVFSNKYVLKCMFMLKFSFMLRDLFLIYCIYLLCILRGILEFIEEYVKLKETHDDSHVAGKMLYEYSEVPCV